MKKTWLASTALLFLTACVGATREVDLSSQLQTVWDKILSFFALEFIPADDATKFAAFLRIIIFITVYVIMYEMLTYTVLRTQQQRRTATVIALAMSAIAVVTLPVELILSIGGLYGSLIGAALLLGPILMVVYVIWGMPATTRFQVFIKVIILTVLLWVLNATSHYLSQIGGTMVA